MMPPLEAVAGREGPAPGGCGGGWTCSSRPSGSARPTTRSSSPPTTAGHPGAEGRPGPTSSAWSGQAARIIADGVAHGEFACRRPRRGRAGRPPRDDAVPQPGARGRMVRPEHRRRPRRGLAPAAPRARASPAGGQAEPPRGHAKVKAPKIRYRHLDAPAAVLWNQVGCWPNDWAPMLQCGSRRVRSDILKRGQEPKAVIGS